MNLIRVTHNPFTVDTVFQIKGHPPADSCKLTSYRELRLQQWIDVFFDELTHLFNGDNRFHVIFTGVESDFLDMREAAEDAVAKGIEVELEWIKTVPTEDRLDQVRYLIREAGRHPKFNQFLQENNEAKKSIEEAFNRDFDVYVVATMSSGKSTLINAMLGRDLLPAANEATTATIARITDNDSMRDCFSAKRYDRDSLLVGQESDVDLECLVEWNKLPDTQLIDIEGDIVAIKERKDVRLVITDTPGPNNSQDPEHRRTTMGYIQDSKRNPLILYVLNATQLGTNDDQHLLGLVAENMRKGGKQSKDRFIFVVNKMDVFDPESGEDVSAALARVRQYLVNNGIQNPVIYPVSANLTRLIRKPHDKHTRRERNDFTTMADLFNEEPAMDMLQYMPITSRVHRSLAEKNYSTLLLNSGLPAVEAMIDEYIDKYNLPHRLKRAYDALSYAIQTGMDEAELIQQLEQDELALEKLNEEIMVLQQKKEKGFDTAVYKDKLEREGKALPRETEQELIELEATMGPVIKKIGTGFSRKEVSVSSAETMVKAAEESINFYHQKLVNLYETVFVSSQDIISKDLNDEYQRYINEIFSDSEALTLPILDGIKKKISSISLNLDVTDDDIKEKHVVTGTRVVSISKWWNPFSWGATREVDEYGAEKYVNLEEIWDERITQIEAQFSHLVISARDEIDKSKDILIEQFIMFMTHEFDAKFGELLESLEEKANDRQVREHAVAEAKELQDWINNFKAKLDETLAV